MNILKVLAVVITAIALIPSAAHLFELPGKIDLGRDDYFVVQGIYAGWAFFAVPIFLAILANALLCIAEWRQRDARAALAGLSALLIAIGLGIFFVWVFPGNVATENWTQPTDDWEHLRTNWEYGHAADALLVFAAFVATCIAAVGSPKVRGEREA